MKIQQWIMFLRMLGVFSDVIFNKLIDKSRLVTNHGWEELGLRL